MRFSRRAALASASASALMWATAATAQTYNFDIPSESAAKSIPQLARQAGIQILAPADGLETVATPAIKGSYELHAALSTLLNGTGVTIVADHGGTIVLAKKKKLADVEPATAPKTLEVQFAQASAPADSLSSAPTIIAQAQTPAPQVAQAVPQTQPVAAAANPPVVAEEVVVTGSLLGATNFTAPTPVTQVTGVQIQSVALTGVGTVIEQLPFAQVGSGLTRNTTGGQRSGQSYPNLRGLGPVNTLVLIDGMRPTPVNPTNNFDTDQIPQSLLDRFDVVTTGASATYGSDAVAGAVNFILKDHLEGFTSDARYGTSQYGDENQTFVSAAWGTTLLNGRGHFVIGGEFANQYNPVFIYARPWGRQEPGFISLPITVAKANGLPANLLTNNVEIDNATLGGLITACQKGTATATCPASLANITFSTNNATASAFPFGSIVGATQMIGTGNYGVSSLSRYLSPPYNRAATLANFEYDVTPDITAFVTVNYGYLDSNTANVAGILPLKVFSGNPFIPAATQAAMTASGITSITLTKQSIDATQFSNLTDNKNTLLQSFFGVKGSLFTDWNWDIKGSAGRAEEWQGNSNVVNQANLDLAMNACKPLTSNTQVAVTNSTTITTAAQVNQFANPGCVPYNPFGTPSADELAYVQGTVGGGDSLNNMRQYMAQADISGPVFSLPAGAIDLALGANYRYNSVDSRPNVASQTGALGTITLPYFQNQSVWEGYGEVGVPVVRDLLLAKAVDLNGAARYTDYSITGPLWTWKYGGTWDITDWLRLRATRSQDVRAPNFTELSTQTTGGGSNVINPIDGVSIRTNNMTSGNPNLHPEISQNVTAGFVIQPPESVTSTGTLGTLLAGFRASVDYYRIRISGQISTPAPQDVVNRCLLLKIQEFCNDIGFLPGFNQNSFTPTSTQAGFQTIALLSTNLNSTYQDGIDLNISERIPLEDSGVPGVLQLSALGSYIDQQSIYSNSVDANGNTIVVRTNYADFYSAPRWAWNVSLTYLLDKFTGTLQLRYYSPLKFLPFSGAGLSGPTGVPFIGPEDPGYAAAIAAGSTNTINTDLLPASVQFNVGLTYDVIQDPSGQDLQVYLNIDNLLNTSPPVGVWANISNYDVVGRYFRFGVRYTLP